MSAKYNRIFAFFCFSLLTLLFFSFSAHAFSIFSKYQKVDSIQGVVTLPIADVNDGKAHYYEFDTNGHSIRFFVLKSSDGIIRAAFDACDVCFESRKGYIQNDEFMVCQNCGQRFHSARINEVKGGCNPAPLTRSYDDKTIRFNVADIAAGASYF